MICDNHSTQTPYSQLILAASHFQDLMTDDEVTEEFAQFREMLWHYIEVATDPNIHLLAWNLIDKYAKADLAEYQATGNTDALERLKYKVNHVVELL